VRGVRPDFHVCSREAGSRVGGWARYPRAAEGERAEEARGDEKSRRT
jgi:hypothetical protein